MKTIKLALGLLVLLAWNTNITKVDAQQITWSSPGTTWSANGVNEGNVSTQGTEVDGIQAFTGGSTLTLYNGVVFNGTTLAGNSISDASGDIVITNANTYTSDSAVGGGTSTDPAYSTLEGNIDLLGGPGTITFNNLIAGRQYQVEVWTQAAGHSNWGINLAGSTPVGMTGLVNGQPQNTGTLIVGTFTATGTSMTENFNVNAYTGGGPDLNGLSPTNYAAIAINAVQLRDITSYIDISQPPYNASTSNSDNGPIFQNAINALLAAGGGTLYIPNGNWKFTTPITVTATTGGTLVIRGDGAHEKTYSGGTDLIFETRNIQNPSSIPNAITFDGHLNPANFPRICIRDLAIDGGTQTELLNMSPSLTTSNFGNQNGLVLNGANNFELSGVAITGFVLADVLVENSSYGSIRDASMAWSGIGVDCLSDQSLQLDSIEIHYTTIAALRDPSQTIGVSVEGNNGNGIVLDSNSPPYVSLHDAYLEGNNNTGSQEGADIVAPSSGSPTISLSLGGFSTWNAVYVENNPYRRIWGSFASVERIGANRWNCPSNYAALDVTNTTFLDACDEQYPANMTWKQYTTGNTYQWRYVSQTISNYLP